MAGEYVNDSTGTIQPAPVKVIQWHSEYFPAEKAFTPATGANLVPGQEVILDASGHLIARTLGSQLPIGHVSFMSGKSGKQLVRMYIVATGLYKVKASTMTYGDYVRQDGTVDATGYPNIVKAASGEYATGFVYNIKTGAIGDVVNVGLMLAPYKMP